MVFLSRSQSIYFGNNDNIPTLSLVYPVTVTVTVTVTMTVTVTVTVMCLSAAQ
jgi:hypothetical protein